MPIIEKINQIDDLYFYEILKNPALCNEFINNIDLQDWEEPFSFTEYQEEVLCDFNPHISICTARATGKCLHEDARILNPKTGEVDSVKNWFFRQDLDSIVSIDDNWKQSIGIPKIEPNGIKDCIEIKTTNGFKTVVTEEHPLLTNKGFIEADKLKVGDFVAVPTQLNYFGITNFFTDNEIKILAHFVAEGTYHVGSITTTESEVIKDIYDYATEVELDVRIDKITYFLANHNRLIRNKYLELLESLELRGCHSYNKFIPIPIFKESKEHISLFLQKLFDDDGWCLSDRKHVEV